VDHSIPAGISRLADPKISLASLSSIFLGTALAARDGALSVAWLAVTVAGIFALEIAKNASGEIFDFVSDSAVSGGANSILQRQARSRGRPALRP
jgi:1,4-dihydroxy-2-naphthoate octaprenyltransferase